MNRTTKRAMQAKAKMQRNAANVKTREVLDNLETELARYQRLCFAIIRDQGRVRVPKVAFDALHENDALRFKSNEATGDLFVEYVPAGPEPEKEQAG